MNIARPAERNGDVEVPIGQPLISTVIPTYNRVERLKRVLDALDAQTLPQECFEVIVVSDGSSDGTDAYMSTLRRPNVRYARQENAGPAAARNRGVAMATAPLILFLDDDVLPCPDLVERHIRSHDSDDLVIIGPMLNPKDFEYSPWVRWEQAMLYRQYAAMSRGAYEPTYRQFYTGNASLSRAAVLDAGGFDVTYRRAEDVELAHRLDKVGFRFRMDFGAIGFHYADRPFESWLRNARDYGANDVVFSRQDGGGMTTKMIGRYYRSRHPLTRLVARLCIRHPHLEAPVNRRLLALMATAQRAGWDRVSGFALSGIYAIAYYRGVADELGGADRFRELVVRRRIDWTGLATRWRRA